MIEPIEKCLAAFLSSDKHLCQFLARNAKKLTQQVSLFYGDSGCCQNQASFY